MAGMPSRSNAQCVYSSLLLCCLITACLSEDPLLRIVPASKTALQTTINANFPFVTPLQVEAVNNVSVRVSSSVTVTAVLSNARLCLADPTFVLSNGVGTFAGSVCEVPTSPITITFEYTGRSGKITSDATPALTVTGNIYFSHFHKERRLLAAEYNRFIHLYLHMYNEGLLAPSFKKASPDRKFQVQKYITGDTPDGAFKAYREMKAVEKASPHLKSAVVLGTSENELTKTLLPFFTRDKYAVMSFTDDYDSSFSDKSVYPYYNRISVAESFQYHAVGIVLKDRGWNKVICIYDEDTQPSPAMKESFSKLGVECIREHVIFNNQYPGDRDSVDPNWMTNTHFDAVCEDIKKSGTQVVISWASGNAAHYLMGAGMKNGITCTDGYQWIYVGEGPREFTKRGFPYQNDMKICHNYGDAYTFPDYEWPVGDTLKRTNMSTWCSYRYRGAFHISNYPTTSNGMFNREYFMMQLEYYYGENPLLAEWEGHTLFDPERLYSSGGTDNLHLKFVKAYDAAKINVQVIAQLIEEKKTITGELISKRIRANNNKKDFEGLSSLNIKFDANGDAGSIALGLETIYPDWMRKFGRWGSYEAWTKRRLRFNRPNDYFIGKLSWDADARHLSRIIFFKGPASNDVTEVQITFHYKRYWMGDSKEYQKTYRSGEWNGTIIIDDKFKNKRTFESYNGVFEITSQLIINEYWNHRSAYKHHLYTLNRDEPEKEVCDNAGVCVPKISLKDMQRVEWVAPAWHCKQGCGGKILNEGNANLRDVNIYEHGICVSRDECKCTRSAQGKQVWSGHDCSVHYCKDGCVTGRGDCEFENETITYANPQPGICNCKKDKAGIDLYMRIDCAHPVCPSDCNFASGNGVCNEPGKCECKKGYFGKGCGSECKCGPKGTCNDGYMGDGDCVCEGSYVGETCTLNLAMLIPVIIVSLTVSGIALFFFIRFYLAKTKNRAALRNNDWIVKWTDLKRHDEATGRSSMFLSAISMNQKVQKKVGNTGIWNGIDVHYQRLEKDSIPASKEVRFEVKMVRDIRHVNVASFVGLCLDAPNVCILTEIAPKGSLEDILTNEEIRIPWDFRYPIMKGICAGMAKLHASEVGPHGRLKSCNVLIDGRWTPKVTGFGLPSVRRGQRNVGVFGSGNVDTEKANYGSLLWTSPEILLTGVYHIDHVFPGTFKNDVYSFGMLMSEIATRDHPFSDVMLEKADLIDLIKGKSNSEALRVWNEYIAKLNMESGGNVRPCIKDNQWPKKFEQRKALKKLMDNCWHNDPDYRPSFREAMLEIERIDPQQVEIMDRLVKMLEKYSTNLEDVVTKRTKQLAREKQKTEDLVSRLLPKSVAEDLKAGKRVEPENFDAVTIFFSDIVGFTTIARASTPLQVVTLLNDMYTSFDSISSNYDLYKVETIGDAYMIVSGLPTRNGDKHAGEIATCAMDLIVSIGDFKIRHMPDKRVELRVGLHTGSCVAGVVGLKMPRYCLFGETVKIAEKMESGGKAMRIHISEPTKDVLDRLGGYEIEPEGQQEIKGKIIKTYWLNGKEGYGKTLPVSQEEE